MLALAHANLACDIVVFISQNSSTYFCAVAFLVSYSWRKMVLRFNGKVALPLWVLVASTVKTDSGGDDDGGKLIIT